MYNRYGGGETSTSAYLDKHPQQQHPPRLGGPEMYPGEAGATTMAAAAADEEGRRQQQQQPLFPDGESLSSQQQQQQPSSLPLMYRALCRSFEAARDDGEAARRRLDELQAAHSEAIAKLEQSQVLTSR